MDTLTHALSGALAARATAAGRAAPPEIPLWQRYAVGMTAAAFPDIDFVIGFVSRFEYLMHHRGVTHSIALLPLWALLLAWLAGRIFRNPRGFRPYVAISAIGIALHIVGDLITSFGTMVFAPFSDLRVAWNLTFIIDLWVSGIIIAGLAASFAWRRSRIPAVLAGVVLAAYVGFQWYERNEAVRIGEEFARSQGLDGARVSALPRPVSPLNWTIVVAQDHEFRYAHVNLWRKDVPAPAPREAGLFERISSSYRPPNAAVWSRASLFGAAADATLARAAWEDRAFAFYRWFADYPALLRIDRGNPSTCVWFRDLRFENPGTERDIFRIGLCRENEGPWLPYSLDSAGTRQAMQ